MGAFKTILIHLADPRRAKRLIDATVQIARAAEAHIIGLYVLPPTIVLGLGMPGTPSPLVIDDLRKAVEADAAAVRLLFETAIAGSGCRGEWRVGEAEGSSVFQVVLMAARSADLVVANQTDPTWRHSELCEFPDALALEGGRPVLIVPNADGPIPVCKRVLVGWNGRREAARAVFDALPLHRNADLVCITRVNPEGEPPAVADIPVADLAAALSRHGVRCECSTTAHRSGNAGTVLLSEAARLNADLLVMGCYGHSRLREFVLGGATRHVLKHMHLPVLVSY